MSVELPINYPKKKKFVTHHWQPPFAVGAFLKCTKHYREFNLSTKCSKKHMLRKAILRYSIPNNKIPENKNLTLLPNAL